MCTFPLWKPIFCKTHDHTHRNRFTLFECFIITPDVNVRSSVWSKSKGACVEVVRRHRQQRQDIPMLQLRFLLLLEDGVSNDHVFRTMPDDFHKDVHVPQEEQHEDAAASAQEVRDGTLNVHRETERLWPTPFWPS